MKKLVVMVLVVTMLFSNVCVFGVEKNKLVDVQINGKIGLEYRGKQQAFVDVNGKAVMPVSYNSSTYLPVRAICSILGINIEWDEKTNRVLIQGMYFKDFEPESKIAGDNRTNKLSYKKFELNKNIGICLHNGGDYIIQTMEDEQGNIVYPLSFEGTTYLPIRAIADMFRVKIVWVEKENKILLGEYRAPIELKYNNIENVVFNPVLKDNQEWLVNKEPLAIGTYGGRAITGNFYGVSNYFGVDYFNDSKSLYEIDIPQLYFQGNKVANAYTHVLDADHTDNGSGYEDTSAGNMVYGLCRDYSKLNLTVYSPKEVYLQIYYKDGELENDGVSNKIKCKSILIKADTFTSIELDISNYGAISLQANQTYSDSFKWDVEEIEKDYTVYFINPILTKK